MVEKGSIAVGGQGDSQEWGEVMALRQGHAFTGNSSFGCSQRNWLDYLCDVYSWRCTGYRKGCTAGTLLDVLIKI